MYWWTVQIRNRAGTYYVYTLTKEDVEYIIQEATRFKREAIYTIDLFSRLPIPGNMMSSFAAKGEGFFEYKDIKKDDCYKLLNSRQHFIDSTFKIQ